MTQSEGLQEFQSQNYDRAFELLLLLAEAGDAESQAPALKNLNIDSMAINKERPMTIKEHLLGLVKSEQEQPVPSSPASSFDIQQIITNLSDGA
jgi:hypothetical protein